MEIKNKFMTIDEFDLTLKKWFYYDEIYLDWVLMDRGHDGRVVLTKKTIIEWCDDLFIRNMVLRYETIFINKLYSYNLLF